MTAGSAHSSHGIGRPWLALCFALAVHVAEEAFTGFLPFYSDATRAVSELLPFVTSPSLILAASMWTGVAFVAILTALAPLAYHGASGMRIATIAVALVALANVSGHIVGSVLAGQALPGVYTTPLLAVVGIYALVYAWRWKPGSVEACDA